MSWGEILKAVNSDIKKSLDILMKELFSSKVTPIDTKVTTTQTKVNGIESKVNSIDTKVSTLTSIANRGNIKSINHYSSSFDSYYNRREFSVADTRKSLILVNVGGNYEYYISTEGTTKFYIYSTHSSQSFKAFVTIIEFY